MSGGLAGYDAWRLASPPEYEREGAIESLLERPEMFALQRRLELAEGRVAALERRLASTQPSPYRVRLILTLRWAQAQVRGRKQALQNAIDEWSDDDGR